MSADRWPELPLAAWRDTRDTLHLWTQVVGKVRLALTPWLNHSWHVALYVTARGLTTSPIPWQGGSFEIEFDFIDHVLWLRTERRAFPPDRAQADVGCGVLRRAAGMRCASSASTCTSRRCRARSPTAFRSSRTRCTRPTMPTMPTASGACCCPRSEVMSPFPHRLSRQGEPGAFLLGQFRSGGDALFRAGPRRAIPAACRTCRMPWRRRPIRTRCRAPASGRVAAGRSTMRRSIPMPIRRRRVLARRR